MSGDIQTLMVYTSASDSEMFAANAGNIYQVTSTGAVGAAAVSGLTNNKWQFTMMGNAGDQYLYIVNGADAPRHFNGTVWATPTINGVDETTFINISLHKKRLWFTPVNSMSLWYLAVDAIAGDATEFPVSALFKRGGYIMATNSWSVDAGDGMDDMFIIITSEGEIAIYAGTDPASASTWDLIGIYTMGKPLGTQMPVPGRRRSADHLRRWRSADLGHHSPRPGRGAVQGAHRQDTPGFLGSLAAVRDHVRLADDQLSRITTRGF